MVKKNGRDGKGRFKNTHSDLKYSRGRTRKRPRYFLGNADSEESGRKRRRRSTSARKMRDRSTSSHCDTRNRIINISILFSELERALCCSECHGPVHISESSLQGFGFKIDLVCDRCGQIAAINSSKKVGPMNNAWEINRRSVLAMRALGRGHTGLSTLCGIMDLSTPVAHSAYDKINE